MKYNFDEIIERRGTNSYKWDLVKEDGVIPMWVADMDFQTAPCIIEALQKRVAHGIFGYTLVPDSYYEAIISWFARRHQWNIEKDWIEGYLHARRKGLGTDSSVQLLLLQHYQQWLRSGRK